MDAPSRNAAAALMAPSASRTAAAWPDASEEAAREGGLYARLFRQGYQFSFFQAVRLAEQLFPHAAPLGATSDVAGERLRLRPARAQAFPAADLRRVERLGAGDDALTPQAHVRITATFLGLYGVDGPLPTAYAEPRALVGEDGKPSALRHFLDLFNHRLYAFFYRSWKKHRPQLGASQPPGAHGPASPDLHAQRFLALAGLGTPGALVRPAASQGLTPRAPSSAAQAGGMQLGKPRLGQEAASHSRPAAATEPAAADEETGAPVLPPMRLAAFAGLLARRTRSAEGLRALLAGFFEGLPVRIVENVPRWIPLQDRPRMGGGEGAARLGVNACIGAHIYDRSTKFRIELGPMGSETFRAFLPGQAQARQLQALVRLYVPDVLAYEVKLTLRPEAAPHAQLGERSAQLGRLAVLGRAPSQPLGRVVAYEGS